MKTEDQKILELAQAVKDAQERLTTSVVTLGKAEEAMTKARSAYEATRRQSEEAVARLFEALGGVA